MRNSRRKSSKRTAARRIKFLFFLTALCAGGGALLLFVDRIPIQFMIPSHGIQKAHTTQAKVSPIVQKNPSASLATRQPASVSKKGEGYRDAERISDQEFDSLVQQGRLEPSEMPPLVDEQTFEEFESERDLMPSVAEFASNMFTISSYVDRHPENPELKELLNNPYPEHPRGTPIMQEVTDNSGKPFSVTLMDNRERVAELAFSIKQSESVENRKSVLKTLVEIAGPDAVKDMDLTEIKEPGESERNSISLNPCSYSLFSKVCDVVLPAITPITNKTTEILTRIVNVVSPAAPKMPYTIECKSSEVGSGKKYDWQGMDGPDIADRVMALSLVQNFDFPLKTAASCIKNQGSRGSCTAFAAAAAVETRLAYDTGTRVNLSEQALYFKGKAAWDPTGYDSDGYFTSQYFENAFPIFGKSEVLSGTPASFTSRLGVGRNEYRIPFETRWNYNPSPLLGLRSNERDFGLACYYWPYKPVVRYGETCSATPNQGKAVAKGTAGAESGKYLGGYLSPITNLAEGALVPKYFYMENGKALLLPAVRYDGIVMAPDLNKASKMNYSASAKAFLATKQSPQLGFESLWFGNNDDTMRALIAYLTSPSLPSPVAIGMNLPSRFSVDVAYSTSLGKGFVGPPIAGDSSIGGHAMLAVGYLTDSQIKAKYPSYQSVSGGGYFIVKNSWSTRVADAGYFYIPYNLLKKNINSAIAIKKVLLNR